MAATSSPEPAVQAHVCRGLVCYIDRGSCQLVFLAGPPMSELDLGRMHMEVTSVPCMSS